MEQLENFVQEIEDKVKSDLQSSIGPLQLGSRDQNSPQNILYYGL